MNYPTVFDLIAEEFGKAGVAYALVGGFAVNAYHVARQTADVDLLLVDPTTLKRVCAEGKMIKIAGNDFRVPSLRHLIAMKLHAIKSNPSKRWVEDLPDIVALMKKNRLSLTDPVMIELCGKFGTSDIWVKLKEFSQEAYGEK